MSLDLQLKYIGCSGPDFWNQRTYKGVKLECGYRLDLVVENVLILEIKCTEHILPVDETQIPTYLRMIGRRVGLILNFNVPVLTRGEIIRKFYNSVPLCLRGEKKFNMQPAME